MGYYKRRSYRSWRSRGHGKTYESSKYVILARMFGPIISEIRQAFLALREDALDELFQDYGSIHGASAERYARKTFPHWSSGNTKLSGQTMERLVELVPPYLDPEQRISIIKKLVEHHKPRAPTQHKFISINIESPNDAFGEVEAAFREMNISDALAPVPEHVMKAATWLYDDDITAARSIISESVRYQNEIMKKSARREVDLLKRTIASRQIKTASYSVELPSGSINIQAYTPQKSIIKRIIGWLK